MTKEIDMHPTENDYFEEDLAWDEAEQNGLVWVHPDAVQGPQTEAEEIAYWENKLVNTYQ